MALFINCYIRVTAVLECLNLLVIVTIHAAFFGPLTKWDPGQITSIPHPFTVLVAL